MGGEGTPPRNPGSWEEGGRGGVAGAESSELGLKGGGLDSGIRRPDQIFWVFLAGDGSREWLAGWRLHSLFS